MKNWKDIALCILLVIASVSITMLWRDEQVLRLQKEVTSRDITISRTQQVIQGGLNNGGKINIQALNQLGWNLDISNAKLPSSLPDSTENSNNL